MITLPPACALPLSMCAEVFCLDKGPRCRFLSGRCCIAGGAEPAEKQQAAQPVVDRVAPPPAASSPPASVLPVSATQVPQPEQQPSAVVTATIAPTPVPERTTKYRHQWLQTPTHVEVPRDSNGPPLDERSQCTIATLPSILGSLKLMSLRWASGGN